MGINGLPHQILGDRGGQVSCLQCCSPERPDRQDIGIPEGHNGVRQIVLLAQIPHERCNPPEMTPRQAGEQVVLDLELQPPVEPVHPCGAGNVEGALCLFLKPVVPAGLAHIDAGREVIQAELDMLDPGDREAGDHEHQPLPPAGQEGHEQREPDPEDEDAEDLLGPVGNPLLHREQEHDGLGKEVDAGKAHDRVKGPVLVADEEPGHRVEVHPPLVEAGCQGAEEARGDDEEGHVLEVGVVVEAVAGNVVRIVVPLPPANADARQAVPSEDLGKAVEGGIGHDLVVARVVAEPAGLDPDEAHQAAAGQVDPGAPRGNDAVDTEGQQDKHRGEGDEDTVPLLLEEPHPGKLRGKPAVVLGDLGDPVVAEAAHVEAVEVLPGGPRVVGYECVGDILPGEVQEGQISAGMIFQPRGHIVNLALDRDPQILRSVVLPELFRGNVHLLSHPMLCAILFLPRCQDEEED